MLWMELSNVVVLTWADCCPVPRGPPCTSDATEYIDIRFAMLGDMYLYPCGVQRTDHGLDANWIDGNHVREVCILCN